MSDGSRRGLLDLIDISKSYGPLRALSDISVTIERGSIHALVGENGAGKSTLGKIIAGVISPDTGRLLLAGEEVTLTTPRRALDHGIAAVAQELSIVDSLTIAQNVFLGAEPKTLGFIRRRELRDRFNRLASSVGFALSPDTLAGELRIAEKQQVEILRALARRARLLVLDEPTAALSGADIVQFHATLKSLSGQGTTIVLVSHFLEEVLDLADEVTVLRDGQLVRTAPSHTETKESLIQGMLGRSLSSAYPQQQLPDPDADVVLSVRDLSAPGIQGVSFDIHAGEIVGLAGLVGSGRSEVAHAVSGAARRRSGSVTLQGGVALAPDVSGALRAGVVMIAESRKEQGLFLRRSVSENIVLASLAQLGKGGFIRRRLEASVVERALHRVGVRPSAAGLLSEMLSGGNQQKILFARALLSSPKVLVADEPTRGIDIGSKRAIYDLVVSLAAEGAGVLLVSSDLEEVMGMAHRVLVMRGGRLVAILQGEELTERAVVAASFGDVPTEKVL
ncbi:MAG: sugar ABC transporter ATP-binding protein [Actinomycetota bacterium]|nr:sugar ABC transporter ATP-binding protein [Actinomycetota bacterium]